MLPSLTVMVVTRKDIFGFRHFVCEFYRRIDTIESGFSKASEINRNALLEYKEKKINKRVPLVLTYHPSLEKIAGIVTLATLVTTWFTLADRR
jgi:hypothetical protein